MGLRKNVVEADNWFELHAFSISRVMEIVFGLIWGIDAALKFRPEFIYNYSMLIAEGGKMQPQWFSGWFTMWANITSSNPALFAYFIIACESLLALSLILGIARKIGYGLGFIFSLLIWSIPEGLGLTYGPSATNIGSGIIFALVFVFLALISSIYGPNKYTVDFYIEKKLHVWKDIAEIRHFFT